jgi:7-cyano-7-deazaguanine synthase in queuosine biosynthesis
LSSREKNCYGLTLIVAENSPKPRNIGQGESVAEIGKEIIFNPTILDTYNYEGWKPVHYDLLVVCAAVEFADCRCQRRPTQWSRPFHITVPVWDLKHWQQPDVQKYLVETLCHLTGDDWHFSFVQAISSGPNDPRQHSLPFGNNKEFAMAYSDGLDSRCVSDIYDHGDNAVRVRVSKNKDKINKTERPFDRIPFNAKPKPSRESSVRSRGFKFAAITAIAGQLSGVSRIIVPESGQGALGPVLVPLHNIYADYRNYPTFFRKMEKFLDALLEYSVVYNQPRLWFTKGQTISTFLKQTEKQADYLFDTRSCWQTRRNVQVDGKRRQCGICAACLLRRMSMHAAGVVEPDDTYTFADLMVATLKDALPQNFRGEPTKSIVEYGSVGTRHLQQLSELAGQPNDVLRRHTFEIAMATGITERDTMNKLKILLSKHSEEWFDFVNAQGEKSFLHNWTKGGRYGRSE